MIARRALCAFLFVGSCLAQQYVISTVAGGAPPATPSLGGSSIGAPQNIIIDSNNNAFFTSLNSVFKLTTNGVLTLVAGNSKPGYSGDGGLATQAQLLSPIGLAIDSSGNVYIADSGNNRVRQVSTNGVITTIAGSGVAGFSGDTGPAVSAQLSGPSGVAIDSTGNLYIADGANNRVRKVTPAGVITTIAGNGIATYSGEGTQAISAQLSATSIAIDTTNNLFVGDTVNYRVREISVDGVITTVAGSGFPGSTGDGSSALGAQFSVFGQLNVDSHGNLFIADTGNSSIREVQAGTGLIRTVAGNGKNGYFGDGASSRVAALAFPGGLAFDSFGEVLIADTGNSRIRFVGTNGIMQTVLGTGKLDSGDGFSALTAQLSAPEAVSVDAFGNFYIADTANNRVREVLSNGVITAFAGTGVQGSTGDGTKATTAQLSGPRGIALSSTNDVFIADSGNNRIREVPDGNISTVAINGGDASGLSVSGIAIDLSRTLFIGDPLNFRVRKVTSEGFISIVAGNGISGYSGDDGPATNAQLSAVAGVAVDTSGNIYIADTGNQRIRKVSSTGTITTVAGNGAAGFSGDGGAATKAQLNNPNGVAVDTAGNVFIADTGNNRVRMVSTTGTITTIAGNGTTLYTGDGGVGLAAALSGPKGVAIGKNGIVYVADTGHNAIRLLTPSTTPVIISSVVDAASESATAMTPGKIAVIYGSGLGPAQLAINAPANGIFGQQLAGTTVSFRGVNAPIYYTSATQVAVIVPYEVSGSVSVPVLISYQGQVSSAFNVTFASAAPGIFTANATGAGQAAAINVTDGTLNSATNPVKSGDYISIYATGEGLLSPSGSDGRLAPLTAPFPMPLQKVTATVGGAAATIAYAGAVPGTVEGLMQVNIQIPPLTDPTAPTTTTTTPPTTITAGGRVPVVLTIGNSSNDSQWCGLDFSCTRARELAHLL